MKPEVLEMPRLYAPHIVEALGMVEALARLQYRLGQASVLRAAGRERHALRVKAAGLVEHDRVLIGMDEFMRGGGGDVAYRGLVVRAKPAGQHEGASQ